LSSTSSNRVIGESYALSNDRVVGNGIETIEQHQHTSAAAVAAAVKLTSGKLVDEEKIEMER